VAAAPVRQLRRRASLVVGGLGCGLLEAVGRFLDARAELGGQGIGVCDGGVRFMLQKVRRQKP
jgi:hypothetical protein